MSDKKLMDPDQRPSAAKDEGGVQSQRKQPQAGEQFLERERALTPVSPEEDGDWTEATVLGEAGGGGAVDQRIPLRLRRILAPPTWSKRKRMLTRRLTRKSMVRKRWRLRRRPRGGRAGKSREKVTGGFVVGFADDREI